MDQTCFRALKPWPDATIFWPHPSRLAFAVGARLYREAFGTPRFWQGTPRGWITRWEILLRFVQGWRRIVTWGAMAYDDTPTIKHYLWWQNGLLDFARSVGYTTGVQNLPNETLTFIDFPALGLDPSPRTWPVAADLANWSFPVGLGYTRHPFPPQGRWNALRASIEMRTSLLVPTSVLTVDIHCFWRLMNNVSAAFFTADVPDDPPPGFPPDPGPGDLAAAESALQGVGFTTDPLMWSVQPVIP